MESIHLQDADWVRRCRAGDPAAFEPLVRRYQRAAYAVALTYLRHHADAQDLVQDAFITAYCKLPQLVKPAAFGSWLRSIVVSQCREWVRSRQLRMRYIAPMQEAQPEMERAAMERHRREEQQNAVWAAVERLPEPHRIAAALHYYSGFSYGEIAAFLDLPVSTVRGRLHQSRIHLKNALSPQEQEQLAMRAIEVTENVQKAVCHIAKQEFQHIVPMGDTRHIVLYCGIETDVEIRQARGGEIVLEGMKMTLGHSSGAADKSLGRITILADQVDDFLATGPHRGERISGVHTNYNDKTGTRTRTANKAALGDLLHIDLDLIRCWPFEFDLPYPAFTDVYPALAASVEHAARLPDEVRNAFKRVTRISALAEQMDLMEIPRAQHTDEVKRIFSGQDSDQYTVFGQSGYASVAVSIPNGTTITVFRGRQVRGSGIQGNIHAFASGPCEFSDIDGDIFLFKASFQSIRRVRGRVDQRLYSCGGSTGTNGRSERTEPDACEIADITGGVDIDVLRADIRASNLNGAVRIVNRFGPTTLWQRHHEPGTRCRLESRSGAVKLLHPPALQDTLEVTVNTLCGAIQHGGAIRPERRHAMSCGSDMITRTTRSGTRTRGKDFWDVDVHIVTESGDITVETQDEEDATNA